MSKGMDEQLAELFGRDIPPEKKKRRPPKSKRPSVSSEYGVSHYLDRLHTCLQRIRDGDVDQKQVVSELAYDAALHGFTAKPRENERVVVSDIVDHILADADANITDVRRQLLSAAALAFSKPLKASLLRVLVKYGLEGVFDVSGQFGKTTRWESEFIARVVGKETYISALRHAEDEAERAALEENKAHHRAAAEKVAKQIALEKAITKAHQNLRFSPYSHQLEVAEITSDDLKLIAAWSNIPYENITSIDDLLRLIDGNELTRLWSARSAERAAIEYFRSFSNSVEDISLTQLDRKTDDWATHDINANSCAYDVKNARRSFSSPSSYSEHCVPQFKLARRTENEVAIVGVLSEYLTINRVLIGHTGTSTILGEVTRSAIAEVSAWIENRFGGVLALPALNEISFLPGWIFEFPVDHQPQRKDGKEEARAILRVVSRKDFELEPPKWLMAFSDDRDLVSPHLSMLSDELIWQNLRAVGNQLGFSRRSLFLTILATTLSEAKKLDSPYRPRDWRSWLYAEQNTDKYTKHHPLGLIDSEQYLLNLLETLELIWIRARNRLSEYRRFRLSHPAILKGQDKNDDWYTLIAYCGGWRTVPVKAKCGNSPIHIGESDSCPECHYLICPECGCCNRNCSSNSKRQATWESPEHREYW